MLASVVVKLDPAAAYAEVGPLRAALRRRDWAAARAVLDAVEPSLRSALVRIGGEEQRNEEFLRDVVAGDPGDGAAAAMLGAHLTVVGWRIRTTARAQQVSRRQFAAFHEWLERAEAVLTEAAAHTPRDPAVWVQRLVAGRGLEVGLAEVRRRYQRLATIDPHHLPGQLHMVQSLCPKWGGTWEEMHAFTRDAMVAAGAGAVQGGLVALGHIEHGTEAGRFAGYLKQPWVRAELRDAADCSVRHPEFRRDYGWVWAANTFAMAFSLAGEDRAAAGMFAMAGPLGTESPWTYLGGPRAVIRRRRWRALALKAIR